jgi:hypothetical protein
MVNSTIAPNIYYVTNASRCMCIADCDNEVLLNDKPLADVPRTILRGKSLDDLCSQMRGTDMNPTTIGR